MNVTWDRVDTNDNSTVFTKLQPEESGYSIEILHMTGVVLAYSWRYGGMTILEGEYKDFYSAVKAAESWT